MTYQYTFTDLTFDWITVKKKTQEKARKEKELKERQKYKKIIKNLKTNQHKIHKKM